VQQECDEESTRKKQQRNTRKIAGRNTDHLYSFHGTILRIAPLASPIAAQSLITGQVDAP
jgi:hypothetical protein